MPKSAEANAIVILKCHRQLNQLPSCYIIIWNFQGEKTCNFSFKSSYPNVYPLHTNRPYNKTNLTTQ